jgi:hypothetical protein
MSLKPIKLETVDAKAARVLMAHGRASNMLRTFDESERAALAELCDENGTLVDGASEGFRKVLMAYNDRLKAVDADAEGETVTVQVSEGKSAVLRAAELVASANPAEVEADE